MIRLVSAVIIGPIFDITCALADPVPAMSDLALITATKKPPASRRQEAGQIACTVTGCHRIPPGCHPQTGYNWDGIPTGFDVVVCRYPRAPRG
jgi:hypothetical protein